MWVHNEILRNIARCCAAYGVQEAAVYKSAGIDSASVAVADGKQGWKDGIHLWEAALALCGYRYISLSFGRHISFSVLGWIAPLTTSSATLKLAWQTFADFFPLMGDVMRYDVITEQDGNVTISYTPAASWLEASPLTAALAAEHAMSLTLSLSGYLCGQVVKPLSASFVNDIPARDRGVYKDVFGSNVRSGQEAYTLTFDSATAALRVITANQMMYEQMQQLCAARLQQLEDANTITARVLQLLHNNQGYYSPKLEEMAAMLHLSPRTLQRRLKEEGQTYQSVLESYQADTASQLLARPGTSVKDVAFALGFNSLQSFSRTYKRKTGMSPTAARRA